MSNASLLRTAGGLAILAGLILAFDKIVPDSFLVSTIGVSAGLLGLLAVTGIWLRQKARAGAQGDIGFAINLIGIALMVGVSFLFNYAFSYFGEAEGQAFFAGRSWRVVQVSYGIYAVGVLAFGIAIWRAGVFPRPAAALYTIGFVGAWVGFAFGLPQTVDTVGSLLASAGLVWLGTDLVRHPVVAQAG